MNSKGNMIKVPPRSLHHSRSVFDEVAKREGQEKGFLSRKDFGTLFEGLGLRKESQKSDILDKYYAEMDSVERGCVTYRELLYFLVYHPEVVASIEAFLDDPINVKNSSKVSSSPVLNSPSKSPKKTKKKPTATKTPPSSAPIATSAVGPLTPSRKEDAVHTDPTVECLSHEHVKRKGFEEPNVHEAAEEVDAKKCKTEVDEEKRTSSELEPNSSSVPRRNSESTVAPHLVKAKSDALNVKLMEKLEADSREKEAIAAEAHRKPSAPAETTSPHHMTSRAEDIMVRVRAKEEEEVKDKAEVAAAAALGATGNNRATSKETSIELQPNSKPVSKAPSCTAPSNQTYQCPSDCSYISTLSSCLTSNTGLLVVLASVTAVAAFSFSRGYFSSKR